jgi:GLPGLI family protein
MMKNLFVLLLPFIFQFNASAQTAEKVIAIAKFRLTHHYDTLNTSLLNIETFELFLGKNSSVYKSYDRFIQDSIMIVETKKTGSMAPPPGRRASSEEIFLYSKEKKFYTNVASTVGKFVVERSYPTINWSILSETKNIEGYQCQKAKGDFHGRNFIVWFTNELPFKTGPWKLTGLPGLIIEALDSTKRIKFELISFKTIKNSLNETYWQKKTSIISWRDYVINAKSIEDDPIGYMEKKFGAKVTINSDKPVKHNNPLLPKKSMNFPLESIEYYIQQ